MIGIVAAMECEVEAIIKHMKEIKQLKCFGLTVYEGNIENHECVAVLAGVGKVNAAKATTLICSQYKCRAILNVGVAGGLVGHQQPLDVVIANQVIQHDFDTSPIDGPSGYGIYSITDEHLNNLCQQACQTLQLTYHIGDVASGDQFVTKDNGLNRIESLFPTCVCAEMEAGAIAQIANSFNVPCLIIRALSDVAHHEQSNLDFPKFAQAASINAGNMMQQVLTLLK